MEPKFSFIPLSSRKRRASLVAILGKTARSRQGGRLLPAMNGHSSTAQPVALSCPGWPSGLGKAALCSTLMRKGALDFLSFSEGSP